MNIAEMLEYCPKGTKLYSTVFGEVILIKIDMDEKYPIIVSKLDGMETSFTKEGRYVDYPKSECVIFPSKDQRDWSKFRLPVKRGDIMMFNNRAFIISNEYVVKFNNVFHKYICGINANGTFKVSQSDNYWTDVFYIPASEEAKKELFDKMAEAGYKWDANTLKLEKIESKFKEGDVIIDSQGNLCLVSKIKNNNNVIVSAVLYQKDSLMTYNSNTVERNSWKATLASIENRNKLFSALVREGYKYDKWQHKFIKQEFKPFDKVLVRGNDTEFWKADIYLGYTKNNSCPYRCTKANYGRCIPYEGNEYLLDTANSPTCVDKEEQS